MSLPFAMGIQTYIELNLDLLLERLNKMQLLVIRIIKILFRKYLYMNLESCRYLFNYIHFSKVIFERELCQCRSNSREVCHGSSKRIMRQYVKIMYSLHCKPSIILPRSCKILVYMSCGTLEN